MLWGSVVRLLPLTQTVTRERKSIQTGQGVKKGNPTFVMRNFIVISLYLLLWLHFENVHINSLRFASIKATLATLKLCVSTFVSTSIT